MRKNPVARALGGVAYGRRVRKISWQVHEALAAAGEVAEESIAGIRTVRSFDAEEKEAHRYSGAIQRSFALVRRRARASGTFMAAALTAAYAAVALVLWYGGGLLVRGGMTPGDLAYDATEHRASHSDVASPAQLRALWRKIAGGSRAAKPAGGWLAEPRGYTLLAACRANESAYEDLFVRRESWGSVSQPNQIVSLGQEIEVQVLDVSVERCRVALSLKRMTQNPWERALIEFPVNTILPAIVTTVLSYGAFARIDAGVEGLIHASEMPLEANQSPREFLKDGQQIEVRVLHLDPSHQRMGLSMLLHSNA